MTLNKKISSSNYIFFTNLVFGFFPITFILGNLITNINILLFCFLGIFYLKSRILEIKFDFPTKIIFIFFLIILFSTTLSFVKSLYYDGYEHDNLLKLVKSILFFRFFLMLIIVCLLSEFGVLNFKYFFLTAVFSPILISSDIIYQYFFGFNIIGLEGYFHHNSSFFGDEWIAGGFIQNFSFFSVLFLAFKLKDKKFLKFILITSLICLLGVGILFSGNRMPLILFLLGLIIIFFLTKKLKKIIPASFLILFIIFWIAGSFDNHIKTSYLSFYSNIKNITVDLEEISTENKSNIKLKEEKKWLPESNSFKKLILTGIDTWKFNKIFGNGIKSFRDDCIKVNMNKKNRMCASHPHNYYIEILAEIGIIGFIITMIMGVAFIVFLFRNFKFLNDDSQGKLILIASITSLILEVFPFKQTGSIFTTNNAAYIILIASIILSQRKLLNK
tara:strand:- start:557 stop:1891 length:1335 start_codon:yes stop_codon:yes gene_type:complete